MNDLLGKKVEWKTKNGIETGRFLAFGVDWEATEAISGDKAGHFSAAIVIKISGEVELVPVTKLTFLEVPLW